MSLKTLDPKWKKINEELKPNFSSNFNLSNLNENSNHKFKTLEDEKKFLSRLKNKNYPAYEEELNTIRYERHSDYLKITKDIDNKKYLDEQNYMSITRHYDSDDIPTWRLGLLVFNDFILNIL
jgi:hypothetical protein